MRPRVYCGTSAHSAAQAAGFSHIACHDHRTPWVEVWRPRARGKDAGCLGHVARRRKVLPSHFERRPPTHPLILKYRGAAQACCVASATSSVARPRLTVPHVDSTPGPHPQPSCSAASVRALRKAICSSSPILPTYSQPSSFSIAASLRQRQVP